MIGWIMLSRKAVASAEQALNGDDQGVRDEIGFLALHQAIADRLFPGTSVLHTRLRYALFVPWLMQLSGGDPERLRRDALLLTHQLNLGQKQAAETGLWGVIGGTIWPREPSQTPAMAYWSALSRWGILRSPHVLAPLSRTHVLQRLAAIRNSKGQQVEIDGEPTWSADTAPFVTLPTPPVDLLKRGRPLDFMLCAEEKRFLRGQLIAVRRNPESGEQSLLGRLAECRLRVSALDVAWHPSIRKIADQKDRRCLDMASRASALAGIGRAVYVALVEQASNGDIGGRANNCYDALVEMRSLHEVAALELDMAQLSEEIPTLSDELWRVLQQTQIWLRSRRKNPSELEESYRLVEAGRKGSRARLGGALGDTLGAQRRRAEWRDDKHANPQPLHYRWRNVRALLTDLTTS